MNKIELFSIHQKHSTADFSVWDAWFGWRLKQAGLKRHVNKDDDGYDEWHEKWLEMLHGMPHNSTWRPTYNDTIIVSFGDDETETFPLDLIVEDLDKEPDLTMLWHSDYYDGPLSGMALYNGEHVWFDCNDDPFDGDRIYALYRLSTETKQELLRQHKLFEHHVGTHSNHDPNDHQEYSGGNDPEKYYELQKKFPKIDPTEGENLGDVHWHQFKYWARPK